jgi:Family of unknown function (DUF5398)
MFGLKKSPKEPFQFDLEKDIKQNPQLGGNLIKEADEHIAELKNNLRAGCSPKLMNEYGVLLQGFAALHKVVHKISKK